MKRLGQALLLSSLVFVHASLNAVLVTNAGKSEAVFKTTLPAEIFDLYKEKVWMTTDNFRTPVDLDWNIPACSIEMKYRELQLQLPTTLDHWLDQFKQVADLFASQHRDSKQSDQAVSIDGAYLNRLFKAFAAADLLVTCFRTGVDDGIPVEYEEVEEWYNVGSILRVISCVLYHWHILDQRSINDTNRKRDSSPISDQHIDGAVSMEQMRDIDDTNMIGMAQGLPVCSTKVAKTLMMACKCESTLFSFVTDFKAALVKFKGSGYCYSPTLLVGFAVLDQNIAGMIASTAAYFPEKCLKQNVYHVITSPFLDNVGKLVRTVISGISLKDSLKFNPLCDKILAHPEAIKKQ